MSIKLNQTDSCDRFIRIDEITKISSLAKSTINLWVADGRFPKPVMLSSVIRVWRLSDVTDWMNSFTNYDDEVSHD